MITPIDDLKGKIEAVCNGSDNTTEQLQEICKVFLSCFHIETAGWTLWPTEVEAYCYCGNHKDVYVHQNDLQCNRFGKIYVHRHPSNKTAGGTPKGWAGMDICLSDKDGLYFGMLIRAARVNAPDNEIVIGPYKLYRTLKTGQAPNYFETLEKEVALIPNSNTISEPVFFSKRIGLTQKEEDPDGIFLNEKMRAVIGSDFSKLNYRLKEELFEGRAETPAGITDVEYARMILGYVPANITNSKLIDTSKILQEDRC